ncbi:MAG: nucleoside deaminase, partial [Verrucomicrobiota bacterium]|nr:nucleoside deaminase [Verrucomicrobiota bacterium]
MNDKQACEALRKVNSLAFKAKNEGKQPLAAALLAEEAETILLSACNVSTVKHAEIELVRKAAELYDSEFLWSCTIVTNFEPCAMCTGAIYWANIGRIVYGVSETELIKLTGAHKENPTL